MQIRHGLDVRSGFEPRRGGAVSQGVDPDTFLPRAQRGTSDRWGPRANDHRHCTRAIRVWQGLLCCCSGIRSRARANANHYADISRFVGHLFARNKTVSRRPKNSGSRCHEAVTTHALHRRMCADTCERNTLVNQENQTPTHAHEHEAADS
jgi:hypothetical protein